MPQAEEATVELRSQSETFVDIVASSGYSPDALGSTKTRHTMIWKMQQSGERSKGAVDLPLHFEGKTVNSRILVESLIQTTKTAICKNELLVLPSAQECSEKSMNPCKMYRLRSWAMSGLLLAARFLKGDNHLAVGCAVAETNSVQNIGHHRPSIRLKLRKALLGFFEDFLGLDIKKARVEVFKYGPMHMATWYLVCFV
ncbi:uncharacterized protein LACBIDRAFT_323903 [Laccaria bicolor S238N-H82]|uniref:Predicted protein n=1 Tax=Laccaria bicolor (strain S238N-H82 / ATCC MYA-4686) TaxID=486041 RepID=B0D006_LACBS|nr:uncharacterized protein LACBIDRAFT_323903 [Laccaria bicolor S238N-H82]EDR11375.1 predicted protein [Laccaria bicolor S238N-H82]|eukprot:XP_001877272.1 predicted protein [Laccaria bicolor S238N-H82]